LRSLLPEHMILKHPFLLPCVACFFVWAGAAFGQDLPLAEEIRLVEQKATKFQTSLAELPTQIPAGGDGRALLFEVSTRMTKAVRDFDTGNDLARLSKQIKNQEQVLLNANSTGSLSSDQISQIRTDLITNKERLDGVTKEANALKTKLSTLEQRFDQLGKDYDLLRLIDGAEAEKYLSATVAQALPPKPVPAKVPVVVNETPKTKIVEPSPDTVPPEPMPRPVAPRPNVVQETPVEIPALPKPTPPQTEPEPEPEPENTLTEPPRAPVQLRLNVNVQPDLFISSVGPGLGEALGLIPGDQLVEMNNLRLGGLADLSDALLVPAKKRRLNAMVLRNGGLVPLSTPLR
jgi:hypothetical protein